jgi:predicted deacylase
MAHLFLSEIVQRCTHGVDLHTGAFQRGNLPQIRTNLENPETAHLASTFGAPIVLHADTPDGSLRAVAGEKGVPVLLYEGGEALRFDELTIRTGVRGVLEVMRELEMLPRSKSSRRSSKPLQARASQWLRAPESGILLRSPQLGQHVRAGQVLCHISDPLGEGMEEVRSPVDGLIIGATRSPLVSEGDALFHVARVDEPEHAESRLQNLVQDVPPGDDPLLYEDPRERRRNPVSRLDDGPSRADD